jgi:hypothetical protein
LYQLLPFVCPPQSPCATNLTNPQPKAPTPPVVAAAAMPTSAQTPPQASLSTSAHTLLLAQAALLSEVLWAPCLVLLVALWVLLWEQRLGHLLAAG